MVENLHWSDPTSEAWLASLVERLAGAAVLLLGTYRPGYQPAWGAHAAVTQVAVPPLRAPDSRTVVQAVLGAVSLPEARLRAMVAQAGGNPFFLEELAWHAVEQGGRDTPGAVPETVHAVLAARLDRLPPEEKQLLQTAAVVGTEVPVPLLQAIAELPEAVLHRGLAHLQAAEFLYETRLFPEQVYTFKHALTHEVAYSSLLLERRRVLHARIVEALEALAPEDRVAEQVERLAHHALRGEVWDKAVTYCQQAGARAHDRAAFREAVACLRAGPPGPRAPARARRHPGAGHRSPPRCWEARWAHWESMGGASPCWARPRPWPGRSTIGPGWDGCWPGWPRYCRMTGDHDGAMAVGQQALDLAAALGDSALQGQASHFLGQAYYAIGDFGRAAELLRRNVEAADRESGTPRTDVRILSRAWLARTLSELGAFAEGRRHGEEALRLATLAGRGNTPIVAHALPRPPVPRPRGPGRTPSGCSSQGLALCRASGDRILVAQRSRRAWAMPMRSRGASRRGARCWRRRSAKASARAGCKVRPPGSPGSARSVVWRDAARRPGSTPTRPSTWPGSRRHAGTRRSHCTSLALSRPTPIPPMPRRPKPTTSRPWPWPRSWACARSRRIATTGSARCMPG